MLNNVNGLPAHALLVHFAITIAVSGALGGLAYALVPRFRRWLSWPLLALGLLSVLFGLITPASGDNLQRRVAPSPLVEKHVALGGQMGTIMIIYGVVLVVTMLLVHYRGNAATTGTTALETTTADRLGAIPGQPLRAFSGQPQLAVALTGLVLLGAVVSGIWIYRTGEAGARAVWANTPTTARH